MCIIDYILIGLIITVLFITICAFSYYRTKQYEIENGPI